MNKKLWQRCESNWINPKCDSVAFTFISHFYSQLHLKSKSNNPEPLNFASHVSRHNKYKDRQVKSRNANGTNGKGWSGLLMCITTSNLNSLSSSSFSRASLDDVISISLVFILILNSNRLHLHHRQQHYFTHSIPYLIWSSRVKLPHFNSIQLPFENKRKLRQLTLSGQKMASLLSNKT